MSTIFPLANNALDLGPKGNGDVLLGPDGLPDKQWVRGKCPECGGILFSNMYWIEEHRGWSIVWECWNAFTQKWNLSNPQPSDVSCDYSKIL